MPSNILTLDKPIVVTEDGRTVIRIPMQLRRMGGRKQIIVPNALAGDGPNRSPVQRPLALAVARGHRWRDLLESGAFPSVAALAAAIKSDPSYIRRHIRLTCLSPCLVEAILDGKEPDGLSLEQLAGEIPAPWEKQIGWVQCTFRINVP
ncbi:MAG: hypothetical protein HY897_23665 [Deltaproteobacteria bacterium]|nr:hypothetical protein [Deltaproteobacteria bacterium]